MHVFGGDDWRDDSAGASTGCSCRGPGSQHSHSRSQPPVIPIPVYQRPSSGLFGHSLARHTVHRHTCKQTFTQNQTKSSFFFLIYVNISHCKELLVNTFQSADSSERQPVMQVFLPGPLNVGMKAGAAAFFNHVTAFTWKDLYQGEQDTKTGGSLASGRRWAEHHCFSP